MALLAGKIDMNSAKEHLRSAVLTLQQARIPSASLDARLLLEHVLGLSREQLLFVLENPLSATQAERYRLLIEQRAGRCPVAKLIGQREFWGMNFGVSSATLDPRPDSETLIESVLERITDRRAPLKLLDMGTGSGCLILSLLSELPNAQGTAVDICPQALEVATRNAATLGLASRAQFVYSDWGAQISGCFDVIVSNPPYIPTADIAELEPEVSKFEPKQALDGGADGLECYRAIMAWLPLALAPGGFAAFEIGMGQQRGLEEIVAQQGFAVVASKADLGGITRCLVVQRKE
jgi:release factor glutamine methyltransferase